TVKPSGPLCGLVHSNGLVSRRYPQDRQPPQPSGSDVGHESLISCPDYVNRALPIYIGDQRHRRSTKGSQDFAGEDTGPSPDGHRGSSKYPKYPQTPEYLASALASAR